MPSRAPRRRHCTQAERPPPAGGRFWFAPRIPLRASHSPERATRLSMLIGTSLRANVCFGPLYRMKLSRARARTPVPPTKRRTVRARVRMCACGLVRNAGRKSGSANHGRRATGRGPWAVGRGPQVAATPLEQFWQEMYARIELLKYITILADNLPACYFV